GGLATYGRSEATRQAQCDATGGGARFHLARNREPGPAPAGIHRAWAHVPPVARDTSVINLVRDRQRKHGGEACPSAFNGLCRNGSRRPSESEADTGTSH